MANQYMSGDLLEATKEKNCSEYLMSCITEKLEKGEIDKALGYYELLGRSLRELQMLRRNKLDHDKVEFILNQLEADKQMKIITIIEKVTANEQKKR